MAEDQGLFIFPGVDQILGGNFTLSHGISPSIAMIQVPVGTSIGAQIGTFSIRYGGTTIRFSNCLLDASQITFGSNGQVMTMRILDRRWKWKYGEIWGRYNYPGAPTRTPRELASMLVEAMGEKRADISAITNNRKVEIGVDWIGANPAEELQKLCDKLGCRIVLDVRDRVAIRRNGVGASLPTFGASSFGPGVDVQDRPSSIKIVTSPAVWVSRFTLEAVAEDEDDEIVPLGDAYYFAGEEYKTEDPRSFAGIGSKYDLDAMQRARKSCWKWYRIKEQVTGDLKPPKYKEKVRDLSQLKPFRKPDPEQTKVEQSVTGVYWPGGDELQNTDYGHPYEGKFDFTEDGLVKFDEPVFKVVQVGDVVEYHPAELTVDAEYGLTRDEDGQAVVFVQSVNVPGRSPADVQVLRRKEIIPRTRYTYDGNSLKDTITNEKEVIDQVNAALSEAAQKWITQQSQEAQYSLILPISPDGAIQQVTWTVGASGATTRASRNMEHHRPRFQERRQKEFVYQFMELDA